MDGSQSGKTWIKTDQCASERDPRGARAQAASPLTGEGENEKEAAQLVYQPVTIDGLADP